MGRTRALRDWQHAVPNARQLSEYKGTSVLEEKAGQKPPILLVRRRLRGRPTPDSRMIFDLSDRSHEQLLRSLINAGLLQRLPFLHVQVGSQKVRVTLQRSGPTLCDFVTEQGDILYSTRVDWRSVCA